MSKPLKFILISAASLLILATVIIGGIFLFVDPNDYKDEIATAVHEATGRQLTITGDIKLSIYPWLGLSLGTTQLSNAEGFGDTPFASVETVDIKVKLLPLFQQRLEMQKIRLHGLRANLAKNKEGRNNWDDLAAPSTSPSTKEVVKESTPAPDIPEPAQAMGALATLAIDGLELENAHLEWNDQQANQHIIIDKLSLRTGPLSLPAPIDLSLSLDVKINNPEMDGHVDFSGRVSFDPDAQKYQAEKLNLTVKAQGSGLPISPIEARLLANVKANLNQQQVNISDFQLSALGSIIKGQVNITHLDSTPGASGNINVKVSDPTSLLKAAAIELPQGFRIDGLNNTEVTTTFDVSQIKQTAKLNKLNINTAGMNVVGDVSVAQFLDSPKANGQITIANFSPREVMNKLGITLPNTRDASVLNKSKLGLNFNANMNEAKLTKITVSLDDTILTGTASVKDFTAPAIRFDINVDDIDIDRYLPPTTESTPPTTPGAAATAATQLPLEPLRSLNIDGNFRLDKLKITGARSSDISLSVKAKNGKITLNPIKANLYNGSYNGNIVVDVRKDTPKLSFNEALSGVNVGPLLKDTLGKELVSGTANASAQLTATGAELDAIKKSLNGKSKFSFKNGAVKGVNIGQMIREANAKLNKKPQPPKANNETDFAEMSGSVTITNGIVRNKDLVMKSPLLRIHGKGNIDLPREKISYLVNTSIVKSNEGQTGKELAKLKSLTIPIKVTGTFSKPKFSLDLGPVLQAKAREAVEKKKKQIKKDVEKKIKKEEKKIKNKIEDELKKLFKF